ncbi:MAG: Dabb family protein [Alphaproteobacteria bacterium]
MIMHCVFLNLAEDADIDRLMEAYVMIGEVLDDIDGVYDYAAGPNRDFENKSPAYESGFVITFASKEALDAYAEHPRHKEAGAILVSLCFGGADGIIVFDLDVGDPEDAEMILEG